jgi:hypothetical protein
MNLQIRMVGGFQVEEKRKLSLKKKAYLFSKGKEGFGYYLGRDVGIKVRLND